MRESINSRKINLKLAQNRKYILLGAISIQLCLGVINAWPSLLLKLVGSGNFAFTTIQTEWIYFAGMISFALAGLFSGRMMQWFSSRKIAVISGIMLGSGYILGGLLGTTFATQLLFTGIMGGMGIGLGFVTSLVLTIRWFPDLKGFCTGLVSAGFALGAFIWVKAATWVNLISIFSLDGLRSVFILYGFIFLILITFTAFFLNDPPPDFHPPGWTAAAIPGNASGMINFEANEMLKLPQFAIISMSFFFSVSVGLIVIKNLGLFGTQALKAAGLELPLAVEVAGWAMALVILLSVLGIIGWGYISDMIGRKMSICFMSLLQGMVLILFYTMGGEPKFYILGACVIGFNFGGNLPLFTSITADYFGDKSMRTNYAYVLASYCLANVIGLFIANYLSMKATSSSLSFWLWPLEIAGMLCLILAGAVFMMKSPLKR